MWKHKHGWYKITCHKNPKTLHKFSKTIKKTEKVSQAGFNGYLYSETKKVEMLWTKKNVNITKRTRAFKANTSSYNVEISNIFNLDLHFEDTESAIKNKLKN